MQATETTPLVTLAVLSYNRREDLRRTIRTLLADPYPRIEILILDNGSTDGTREMLEAEFAPGSDPRLTIMAEKENRGIGARNLLFGRARGKYLFSFDDDSYPSDPGLVSRAVEIMEREGSIAALCCSCIHPETGYNETRDIERFASAGDPAAGYELVNVAEGGTLFRMEDVRRTEGYDASFFFSREGNDLGFQMIQLGKRIVFRPDLVVYHLMSPAARQAYPRLTLFTRNTYWILWKYFPLFVAIPMGFLFAIRRLLPAVRDPRRLRPVCAGIVQGMAGFRNMRSRNKRFSLRRSFTLRKWFLKTLYE